jgi:hypothetical protein
MTVSVNSTIPAEGFEAVKARQQVMWASGDYSVIGATLQIVGEQLTEVADVCAGERVLDVAAGSGNATLAAARRFAHVTSTDYVPACSSAAGAAPRPKGSTSRSRWRTPRHCPTRIPATTSCSPPSA